MVYNPLGKNLLFPSWLIGNGKEKLIEEVVLILPTRGRGGGGCYRLYGESFLYNSWESCIVPWTHGRVPLC